MDPARVTVWGHIAALIFIFWVGITGAVLRQLGDDLSKKVPVAANGDYSLGCPPAPDGRLSISWTPLGGATVTLYVRHEDSYAGSFSAPVANGKLSASLVDDQGTVMQSTNVECRGGNLFARVTGYTAPFDIWCS